jgi:hypothetical protein
MNTFRSLHVNEQLINSMKQKHPSEADREIIQPLKTEDSLPRLQQSIPRQTNPVQWRTQNHQNAFLIFFTQLHRCFLTVSASKFQQSFQMLRPILSSTKVLLSYCQLFQGSVWPLHLVTYHASFINHVCVDVSMTSLFIQKSKIATNSDFW